jgi:hypothetical protein
LQKISDNALKRALSTQHPLSELILTGVKKEEYRSQRTHIRERFTCTPARNSRLRCRSLLPQGVPQPGFWFPKFGE